MLQVLFQTAHGTQAFQRGEEGRAGDFDEGRKRKHNTTIAAVFALSRSSSLATSLSDSQGLYLNIPSSSFTQCNLKLNSHWLSPKSRDRNEDHDFRVSGNFSEAFVCLIHFFVLVYSVSGAHCALFT